MISPPLNVHGNQIQAPRVAGFEQQIGNLSSDVRVRFCCRLGQDSAHYVVEGVRVGLQQTWVEEVVAKP